MIKVGSSEAGIRGLEAALHRVHSSGITSQEEIKSELLKLIREAGNYLATSAERDYAESLLREYRQYVAHIGGTPGQPQVQPAPEHSGESGRPGSWRFGRKR